MYPELFSVGPFNLHTFGLMMALGFILCWTLLTYMCRRSGLDQNRFSNLLTLMMLTGVAGARIADVIERWSVDFAGKPLMDNLIEIVRLDHGGLMFYGGLILASISFLIYCRIYRLNILVLADLMLVAVPLGHVFGRIGCFMNGCCHGAVTKGPFGVVFPVRSPAWSEQVREGLITRYATTSLPVLPTQLFEAAGNLLIFAALLFAYLRIHGKGIDRARSGLIAGSYMISYGVLRFAMEFTRGDYRPEFGPLSIGQIISTALILLGISFIAFVNYRRTKEEA